MNKRLVKKLKTFGIRGQVLAWIESWLSAIRQNKDMGDKHSSSTTVLSGVP